MLKRMTLRVLMGLGIISSPQQDTQLCVNHEFHKEVDSYLIYSVPIISVEDAGKLTDTALFLDARELEEYEVSHIPRARYVGYDDFSAQAVANITKDQAIIVYCSIGYRSERIGEKLLKLGYTDVRNLYGSIFEWVNQGNPLVHRNSPSTRIHTYNKKWSKWVQNTRIEKVY